MQVENPNEPLKQKLDALTEVPERFHFNPSAVWAKLEEQLQNHEKSRNRFLFLYAAASVIFIIVSLFVYRNFSKQVTIVPQFEAKKNIESKQSHSLSVLKRKVSPPVIKNIENKLQVKSRSPRQTIRTAISVGNAIAPELITHPVKDSFQNESALFKEKDMREETSIAVIPALPKMRFKIAHINEVNRNTIPDEDITKQAEKIKYGLSLRKEVSFNTTDEKEQTQSYSPRSPKSFFSLINSQ